MSTPITLTAEVSDDGLPVPKPRRPPAVGQETPPTLKPDPNQPEILFNVPQVAGRGRGAIKTGRHIVYPVNTPFMNLGLTLLDKVGAQVPERIGDSTGLLEI